MTEEEMIVAVMAIIGGLSFTTIVFVKIVDLIKSWINRDSSEVPAEEFNALAKAFVKHKRNAERRIQNLEAIIAGEENQAPIRPTEEPVHPSGEPGKIKSSSADITIEQEPPSQSQRSDGYLRNMLRD